ncbi:MAG: FAD-binding protein [Desulfotalea sp.]
MDTNIISRISIIVGKDNISTEQTERILHSYDATQKSFLPDIVVYAQNTEQVSKLVKLAVETGTPIVPRGAASGFTGGSLPIEGGIVLVLTQMDKIIEIDTENLIAVVEPGVVTAELQREVEKIGLFYPPDPASKDFSTLGGNVAECAGGPRCLKYGVTGDYVMGLEVVTPQGDIINTGGKTIKNVVGYNLTKLYVGSEGTLGIVTKIILKLLPKPEAKKTMFAQFESIDGAAQSVSAITRAKIIPATLEFLDASSIDCIRDKSPIGFFPNCKAALIIEVDGNASGLDAQIEKIMETIKSYNLISTKIATTHTESEEIWQVRRIVSPSINQLAPNKFNEDIVVPCSKVPDMIHALESMAKEYNIAIANFGHAGDGNIHVNVMVDLKIEGMQKTIDMVLDKIFAKAIDLGGAISGEHGIGTSKSKWLALGLNEAQVATMQAIKKALDPENILNPGKIFYTPEGGQE